MNDRLHNKFKFVIGVIFCLLLFLFPVRVEAAETKVVRVGFFLLEDFHENEGGNYYGYDVEYLNKIATYTGWKYEFIQTDSKQEALKMLENGQLDLVSSVHQVPENQKKFVFGERRAGSCYGVILSQDQNTDAVYMDSEYLSEIRIGCVRSDNRMKAMFHFFEQIEVAPKIIYFNNNAEMRSALQDGQIEAMSMDIMEKESDEKILAKYDPAPFYWVTTQDKQYLLHDIDHTLEMILMEQPGYENTLMNKYYPDFTFSPISKEEYQFAKEHGVVRVGMMTNRSPISYLNHQTERMEGILPDLLRVIEKKSGFIFELIPINQDENLVDAVEEGKIEIAAGVLPSKANLSNDNIRLTQSIITGQIAIFAREGQDFDTKQNLSIAVIKGYGACIDYIRDNFSNFTIVEYPDTMSCVEALQWGNVDLLIENSYVMENFLKNPYYDKIKVVPTAGTSEDFALAVSKRQSDMVMSILEKALHDISPEEINQYILAYTLKQAGKLNLKEILWMKRREIFPFVSLVIVCIVGSISFAIMRDRTNRLLHKMMEDLTRQKERYQLLVDESEDIIFDWNKSENKVIFSTKFYEKFGWGIGNYIKRLQNIHRSMIHPDDYDVADKMEKLLRHQKSAVGLQMRLRKENGEYIWCEISIHKLNDKTDNIIGKIVDIQSLMSEKEYLLELSQRDYLTGLYNKEAFYTELERMGKSSFTKWVIFIDLDHFKEVNDQLGHLTGDQVLKDVAASLQGIFRKMDIVGRFGGDEFYIILNGADRQTIDDCIDSMQSQLAKTYSSGDTKVFVSASIGALSYEGYLPPQEVLSRVDQALYYAKTHGKNCSTFYDQMPSDQISAEDKKIEIFREK